MQTLAIARATARELLRRRNALLMLVALPLAFYLARRDVPSSAVVVLALGVGWAVAVLTLFATVSALDLDRRLRVAGFTTRAILCGRLLAAVGLGLALSAVYLVLAVVDQDVDRPGGVALMMACAVLVGAPLGMAIGLLLRSELEGALALLIFLATQFMTNPERFLAHCLPLWSVRGVGDWALWSAGTDQLVDGLLHALGTTAVLAGVIVGAAALRLRIHPPDRVLRVGDETVTATRAAGDRTP